MVLYEVGKNEFSVHYFFFMGDSYYNDDNPYMKKLRERRRSTSAVSIKYKIGIDFGSKNVKFGIFSDKENKLIEENILASTVMFHRSKIEVKEPSEIDLSDGKALIINQIKDLVGHDMSRKEFRGKLDKLSYKVEQDPNKRPYILIPIPNSNGETKNISLEEITNKVFNEIRLIM